MKNDDKIQVLDFNEEFLLESAEKRYEKGDYLGALTMLNKRSEMHEPSADASALYADIYEALELYPLCADAWFRFLDTCNEADFPEGYEGLSMAFMNMGDEFRSQLYYRRAGADGEELVIDPASLFQEKPPVLRLIHSADGSVGDPETLREGIEQIKSGDFAKAQEIFGEIPPESIDYPSACGLSAMCLLLEGKTESAAEKCKTLIEYYPENVNALMSYCAVLDAQGKRKEAREIGKRLAEIKVDSTDDLYRVATVLCETGMDAEAYERLTVLKDKLPYDDSVLWFHAVSAYHIGKREEAIDSLERLTTVYPRKAVAKYYLTRMREESGEKFGLPIGYIYKLPDDEYKAIMSFFLMVNWTKEEERERFSALAELEEYCALAFDQADGREDKLQTTAAQIAVLCRSDFIVRDILLDYGANEILKLNLLRDLVLRNEDNSFGVVICKLYREFFTHRIAIGTKKSKQFLKGFAEVYSRYALVGEENEAKLVAAAEEVYHLLDEAGADDCFEDEHALAAVLYREARLTQEERGINAVSALFDANVRTVKEILDYLL